MQVAFQNKSINYLNIHSALQSFADNMVMIFGPI